MVQSQGQKLLEQGGEVGFGKIWTTEPSAVEVEKYIERMCEEMNAKLVRRNPLHAADDEFREVDTVWVLRFWLKRD